MQISAKEINTLITLITLVFVLVPAFLLIYIREYNRKKKKHVDEMELLQDSFRAELQKTQMEVQEQTMQTIATDLHDNVGQLLSLTSLTLNSINLEDLAKTREKIDAAVDFTLRSIKEMRLLGKLLQGDQVLTMGLTQAIIYEMKWIEKTGLIKVTFVKDGILTRDKNAEKDLFIFRILQECLNNVVKHACASTVNISLIYYENTMSLMVKDNGIGFIREKKVPIQSGMGLKNIEKRADMLHGNLSIVSEISHGTTISLTIPYP
jgi:two-component system NarL family sensor kinase